MDIISKLLSDCVWFPIFEVFFIGFAMCAFLKQILPKPKNNVKAEIIRGNASWEMFYITWSIIAVIISTVISSANVLIGYKTFTIIINLTISLYLVFINGWFRNKIIGYWSRLKQIPEK